MQVQLLQIVPPCSVCQLTIIMVGFGTILKRALPQWYPVCLALLAAQLAATVPQRNVVLVLMQIAALASAHSLSKKILIAIICFIVPAQTTHFQMQQQILAKPVE